MVLVCLILACSLLNLAPNLRYRWQQGSNSEALLRGPQEAELYGLKIVQMLLPVSGHRFAFFRELRERYDAMAPLVNENSTAALGIVAGVGFCILLFLSFIETTLCIRWQVLGRLIKLNLACVLLGTIGGFSSLLSFTVLNQIRGYNRISVFIGFFALFAIGVILTEICRRVPGWAGCLLCVGLVGFGWWDQIPAGYNFYGINDAKMANGRHFVKQIEKVLPKGAMVFELPYLRYPEGGSVDRMLDYEPLSPYLYSEDLRWSYGAIKGRGEDARQRQIASSPSAEMVGSLLLRGFRGIYIDRDGYPDNARTLESQLVSLLGEQPLSSRDSRLAFFDLAPFRARLEQSLEEPQGKDFIERVLSDLAAWSRGCYASNSDVENAERWCRGHAELELVNPFDHPLSLAVKMKLTSLGQPRANFVLDGWSFRRQFIITSSGLSLQFDLVAQPGIQVLRARCDGAPLKAPNDPRVMVFSVQKCRLQLK